MKDYVSRHLEKVERSSGALIELAGTVTAAEDLITEVRSAVEAISLARATVGARRQWRVDLGDGMQRG